MASSTSDNEEFVATTLSPVEDKPREEAFLSRLIVQGQGSNLDSDTVRGKVPVFEADVPDMQVGVINTAYSSTTAVSTGTTVMPLDDTIPQNNEGDEKLTVSITPSSSANILLIEALANVAISVNNEAVAAIFQDSTADALSAAASSVASANIQRQVVVFHRMTAGTTSATTFKLRVGPSSASTLTLNGVSGARLLGGVYTSYIRVTEIVP